MPTPVDDTTKFEILKYESSNIPYILVHTIFHLIVLHIYVRVVTCANIFIYICRNFHGGKLGRSASISLK